MTQKVDNEKDFSMQADLLVSAYGSREQYISRDEIIEMFKRHKVELTEESLDHFMEQVTGRSDERGIKMP